MKKIKEKEKKKSQIFCLNQNFIIFCFKFINTMGCIQPTPLIPNEDLIHTREKRLGLQSHNISEIKEALFFKLFFL